MISERNATTMKLLVFVIFICIANASQIKGIEENNEKQKDDKVIQISSTAERTKCNILKIIANGRTYKSANFPEFMHRLPNPEGHR